jgi:hypothetical protein
MRILNARPFPNAITFGHGPDGNAFLSVITKATFDLKNLPGPVRQSKGQLPIFTEDEPFDPKQPGGLLKFESDLVPFKPRSDIVLVGSAHAPNGRLTKSVEVAIEVGEHRRKLMVFGDRMWSFPSDQADAIPYVIGPADFLEMPLTYARAFGGIDKTAALRPNSLSAEKPWCERNYHGRGFCAERTVAAIDKTPLPNIEDPEERIRTWDSHPKPVGCGFFPRNSRPRSDWFGTFDETWKRERAPRMPADFRFEAYNGADPSLQVSPYLVGNEPVALSNVTPGGGRLQFQLPGFRPVVTVTPKSAHRPLAAPKPTGTTAESNLDTIVFCPEASLLYLVWRATFSIATQDASELVEARIEYADVPQAITQRSGAG